MVNDAKTKKLTFYGMALALALVLSYVESVIPINIGIPGAKLGLPNIITLMLIYTAGALPAFVIGLFRIVLSGFMFGNLFAIIYSACGFVLSYLCMLLLKKCGSFGMLGISCAGGVMHNAGQIMVAVLITNMAVLSYLPVLIGAGIAAGILIGILGGIMTKRLAGYIGKIV